MTTDDTPEKTFNCSFCDKTNREVSLLVAGPACFICDECIGCCMKVMGEQYRKSFAATRPIPISQ